ncbi:MAG: 5'-nucleotidase C-terminal domain-containing protein, partial [Gemmatimonadota bacterium]
MTALSLSVRHLVFAACAAALAACAPAATTVAGGERVEIVVLGTTDLHGRLYPYDYYRGEVVDHGLARVATLVDSIRAVRPHVVLLDSGDLLQGNPLDYYFGVVAPADVHPVIAAMNRLRYDAAAIGNHEFNYGLPALERALEDAEFPFLGGNVFRAGTNQTRWPAMRIVERAGVRIAVLGFTTPGSAVWDRRHVRGKLDFRDVVAAARRAWPEAERESDVQVAIIHSGMGPGSSYDEAATGVAPENVGQALAEALPGLDLVLLGHSHRSVPADTVNGVIFAQAGRWGDGLAVATLALERAGAGWNLVGRETTVLSTAEIVPAPGFLAALRPAHNAVVAYVADTIGWTPVAWSAADARLVDEPITDLIQRVQLDATGAELSAASAFTTEARMGPGPITLADAAGLYLYDNTLVSIRVTGRQLRDYLEHAARYFHQVTPDGALVKAGGDTDIFVDSIPGYNYDMVAGVSYALDLTQPVGDRVRDLTRNGRPVRDGETFTLALNSYRQGGGGGFAMIQGAPVVQDRQLEIRQALVDWVGARDTIRPADVAEASWRLLPEGLVARYGAGAARLAGPADTTGLAALAARETARIRGEAGSRVDTEPHLPSPLPATSDSVRLAILATNDFHGALEPLTPAWAGGDTIGGAATLAGYIRAIRDRYPGATLHLNGGDVMQGTVISNLTAGRSTVDVLNAIGLDGAAIGNHEFDWGVDTLRARIAQAQFPWLAANIFVKAT